MADKSKFHVTPTGQARACSAQTAEACKYSKESGEVQPHFETREEAKAYAEKKLSAEHGETTKVSKKSKKTPASNLKSKTPKAKEDDTVGKYFDNQIAPTHGNVAPEVLEQYRNQYIQYVSEDPETLRSIHDYNEGADHARDGLKEYTAESLLSEFRQHGDDFDRGYYETLINASKPNSNQATRVDVDTKAHDIRVGDVIHGETFKNGHWADNDSGVVTKVEESVGLDLKTRYTVTYDNGNVAEFAGGSPVTIRRDSNKVKEAGNYNPTKIRRELKAYVPQLEDGELMTKKDFAELKDYANDVNAPLSAVPYLEKIGNAMEDNNQHDPAIRVDAYAARIKMNHDASYEPDRNEKFALIYDEENSDSDFINKLREENPDIAKRADESWAIRQEINNRPDRIDDIYA